MPSITFSPGTTVPATWLNDVNVAVFTTLPSYLVSPSFTSPSLGIATATSINKNVFTQPATVATWTLADTKTFTCSNTLTIAGTDGSTLNIGTGGTLGSGAYATVTGTNTGDQLTFKTISVSGQSDVVADTTTDTLTLVAGTNITMTTDASTDSVTINAGAASGMVLLATVNPTAAANVDFLNVFSSTYDNYFVIIDGVISNTAATDLLSLRVAIAGVVDTTSIYYADVPNSYPSSGASLFGVCGTSGVSSGSSSFIKLLNVNSSSTYKVFDAVGMAQNSVTPQTYHRLCIYQSIAALSGFRLMWSNGSSFTANGVIRVYGIKNT